MTRYIINRLQQFRNDYSKWDTREFTQSDMVTELDQIIKILKQETKK